MKIQEFFDKNTSTLTYIVFDQTSGDAIVIDPVLDYDPASSKTSEDSIDKLDQFLKQNKLQLKMILETHVHADHLTGSQGLKKRYPEAVIGISENIKIVQETFSKIYNMGADFKKDGSQFDRLLKDNEVIHAGSIKISVIATPGHTPACLSFLIEDKLFTGDSLFMPDLGTGRCDFPNGSAEEMFNSIHERIYSLPETTEIYTGHDYLPNGRALRFMATLAEEKKENTQLKAQTTRGEYVEMREKRDSILTAPKLIFPSIFINMQAGKLPEPEGNGQRYLKIPLF